MTLAELGDKLKQNPNDMRTLSDFYSKISSEVSPLIRSKPAEAVEFYADIMVLHATNSKKGVDSRIGSMPELQKPPFSSYDSYELLDRQKLA